MDNHELIRFLSRRIAKLESLLMLTDKSVESIEPSKTQFIQFTEYTRWMSPDQEKHKDKGLAHVPNCS